MLDRLLIYILRPVYRLMSHMGWKNVELPTDVTVKDMDIPLEGRVLPAKIFTPSNTEQAKKNPLLVYFHGGGMACGGIESTHYNCVLVYASTLQCTVIGVNYRLAPEFKAPCGVDDCIDSTKYIMKRIDTFASNGKVVVGGDSAGGLTSIATGCAVPNLSAAILFYPNTCYDNGAFESWKTNAKGHALTADVMNIFLRNHLGMSAKEFDETSDPELVSKVFPLKTPDSAIQANMPKTFLVTTEYDLLKDEQFALKEKFDTLGVTCEHHHYEATEHGFMCTEGRNDNFEDGLAKLGEWYKTL